MQRKGPLQVFGLLLVITVFAVASWLLWHQWHSNNLTPAEVLRCLRQIPTSHVLLALGVTVLNYGVILVCYDYLAFRFANVPITLVRVAFAAVTGYAFSYNFGATFAGLPLRYRLYSSWGIPLAKIVQLLIILALTFWFGVFFIAGLLFIFAPLTIPPDQLAIIQNTLLNQQHVPQEVVTWFTRLFFDSRPFGCLLLSFTSLYVGASLLHRGTLKIFRWTLPVPPFRLTVYQVGIAAADMLVAASVLFLLFPPVVGGYLTVLEVYLVAFSLIVLSHVPGGWGVLEAVMITLLSSLKLVPDPAENIPRVFAAIIAFRVIYYMLPLLIAAGLIGWHEYALRRKWIRPLAEATGVSLDCAGTAPGLNGHAGPKSVDKAAPGDSGAVRG
jgi:glycosyltransferase 2 family protein